MFWFASLNSDYTIMLEEFSWQPFTLEEAIKDWVKNNRKGVRDV